MPADVTLHCAWPSATVPLDSPPLHVHATMLPEPVVALLPVIESDIARLFDEDDIPLLTTSESDVSIGDYDMLSSVEIATLELGASMIVSDCVSEDLSSS